MNSNQPFVDQIAGYKALATPASGQPLDGAGYDALLGLLYDGITDADGFNSFLQAFCTVFGCFTATLSIQDRTLGRLLRRTGLTCQLKNSRTVFSIAACQAALPWYSSAARV